MHYQRLEELHRSFLACEAEFGDSRRDAEALEKAINKRLQTDRDERQTKIAAFAAQRDDVNQPPTVRRLAALELDKLEAQVIQPSPEELELLSNLVAEQRQCLHDMAGLQRDFREAYDDAMEDLKQCRAAVLGSHVADMGSKWVDSLQEKFSRLAGGDSHG